MSPLRSMIRTSTQASRRCVGICMHDARVLWLARHAFIYTYVESVELLGV